MWRRCWPLLLLVGMGCNTAVGNYFANRARDLGECVCVDVGGGLGVGGGVKAAGLIHAGLGGGVSPHHFAMGWEYGHGFAFGAHTGKVGWESKIDAWLPIPLPIPHGPLFTHFSSYRGAHGEAGVDAHACAAVLPATVLTEASAAELGSRWVRVHAWDIEASVFAGFVYAHVGFSPGEFLDFLLGWFGVDIAGDDRSLVEDG